MEADLSRFHGYRWRLPNGPRLTFLEVAVRLRFLPGDAATRMVDREFKPEWDLHADLLERARLVAMAVAGVKHPEPHPSSPQAAILAAEENALQERRAAKMEDARRRQHEEQQRRLAKVEGMNE